MIDRTCALARRLADGVAASAALELAAPVGLNIVCFSVLGRECGERNAEIVADLQLRGLHAPSTTTIGGRTVIRAAVVNHRTTEADVDGLLASVLAHPLCVDASAVGLRA